MNSHAHGGPNGTPFTAPSRALGAAMPCLEIWLHPGTEATVSLRIEVRQIEYRPHLDNEEPANGASNGEPTGAVTQGQKTRRWSKEEAERHVAAFLTLSRKQRPDHHPTIREVVEATGVPSGSVCRTRAWQEEMTEWNAVRPPAAKQERHLSDRQLAIIADTRCADPSMLVESREELETEVWEQMLDSADPVTRKRLDRIGRDERKKRRLIEHYMNHGTVPTWDDLDCLQNDDSCPMPDDS